MGTWCLSPLKTHPLVKLTKMTEYVSVINCSVPTSGALLFITLFIYLLAYWSTSTPLCVWLLRCQINFWIWDFGSSLTCRYIWKYCQGRMHWIGWNLNRRKMKFTVHGGESQRRELQLWWSLKNIPMRMSLGLPFFLNMRINIYKP